MVAGVVGQRPFPQPAGLVDLAEVGVEPAQVLLGVGLLVGELVLGLQDQALPVPAQRPVVVPGPVSGARRPGPAGPRSPRPAAAPRRSDRLLPATGPGGSARRRGCGGRRSASRHRCPHRSPRGRPPTPRAARCTGRAGAGRRRAPRPAGARRCPSRAGRRVAGRPGAGRARRAATRSRSAASRSVAARSAPYRRSRWRAAPRCTSASNLLSVAAQRAWSSRAAYGAAIRGGRCRYAPVVCQGVRSSPG